MTTHLSTNVGNPDWDGDAVMNRGPRKKPDERAKIKGNIERKKRHYPRYKLQDREGFSKRFKQACDAVPDVVPGLHDGRHNWFVTMLAKHHQFEISREGVRKWFSGDAYPRPEIILVLSEVLQVDPGWLMFGTNTLAKWKTRRDLLSEDGAVNVVIGMIQIAGGNVAISEDKEEADMFAIIDRRQQKIFARLGVDLGGEKFRFQVPNNYRDAIVVGLILKSSSNFDVVLLPSDIITAYGTTRGPYIELILTKRDKGWTAGGRKAIPVVDNLISNIGEAA